MSLIKALVVFENTITDKLDLDVDAKNTVDFCIRNGHDFA